VTKQELIRWLGVPIHHGARDGSASGLHRQWMHDDVDFDEVIQNNVTTPIGDKSRASSN
jgi:hypothetical protein